MILTTLQISSDFAASAKNIITHMLTGSSRIEPLSFNYESKAISQIKSEERKDELTEISPMKLIREQIIDEIRGMRQFHQDLKKQYPELLLDHARS